MVLVRRILDANTGNVRPQTTQVIAEFVTNFRVSFLIDTNSGTNTAPSLLLTRDATRINDNPQQVRSVIVELGIRNPLEDPDIEKIAGGRTRFDVDDDSQKQKGAARVRHMRIEIPVMNVARRNL
jgi:hypothetical protein